MGIISDDWRIEVCKAIAEEAHSSQYRRGTNEPYIVHPMRVAELVEGDADAECVAWLHDVPEDTRWTIEMLKEHPDITDTVIAALDLMTHDKNEPYMDYIEKISGDKLATKVKIADMMVNLCDQPSENAKKKYFKALKVLTKQIF